MNAACCRYFKIFPALLFIFSCTQNNSKDITKNHPAFQNTEVKTVSEKITRDPSNAKLYFERGLVFHRLKEDTLALNDFKKAANLDPSRAEYFSVIGDLLFEHKDINGSVPWFERAIKLNPVDPTTHLKIAKLMIYIKDYTKAFTEINTVLRQDAMVPEAYFLKGLIYKDLKDSSKAISSFQTAIQVEPQYKDATLQLGILYSAKKDPVALKYFDNAFKMDTTDVFPLYAKGMFYQEQEKYEEAKSEYKNCIYHNSDYSDAYFSTGWILMQQDSLDKAWRQFDLVTKLEPTDAEAYYNRGLCSEMMGKKQEALQDYQQALVFDEKYKEAADGIKRLK